MALSNTAIPVYYSQFRDKVLRGEIPVNKEISQQMNRIDALIATRISTMMTKLLTASSHIVKLN